LLIDLLVMAGVATGASLAFSHILALGQSHVGLSPALGRWILVALTLLVLAPFMIGALRISRFLAAAIATEALPSTQGADLAAAPRRALLVTLQIAILLLAVGPLVALLQPFYPSVPGVAVLTVLLLLLAYPLWRSATNLEGHARAGAQVILEALAAQAHEGPATQPPGNSDHPLVAIPGLGHPTVLTILQDSPALGRSLEQIGLRGRTGATVIAIKRGESQVIFPEADDVLRLGDLVVLTGSDESLELARNLLGPPSGAEARQLPLPSTHD
jgi:CPA2 family monovalent cation:H+ antiporter-2